MFQGEEGIKKRSPTMTLSLTACRQRDQVHVVFQRWFVLIGNVREAGNMAFDALPRVDARAALAVLRRPSLWGSAVLSVKRLWVPGVGVPADYLRFRQQTQRGGTGSDPMRADDLVDFLKWTRGTRGSLG
jgi:hypothetical protein